MKLKSEFTQLCCSLEILYKSLIDATKKEKKKSLTDQNSRTFNTNQVYFSTEN